MISAKQLVKMSFPSHRLRYLLKDASETPTHMTVAERIALYELACSHIQTGKFLEIGSYLGASSAVLAEAARRKSQSGQVYCVDTWQNDAMSEGKRSTLDQFAANTKRWDAIITKIIGDSRSVAVPNVICDLVFIDGDHSYEGAKNDADRFAPLVRQGGCLAFHDANRPEVARVAGEMLATGGWVPSRHVDSLIALRRV